MPEAGPPGTNVLFLREAQIRQAQDMFFLAWRDFAGCVDPVLAAHGLGRAHHRAMHFIARDPGLPVGDLLTALGVTKQSLARVLAPLIAQDLVRQSVGRSDRRQRLLTLTEAGTALERQMFERQRELLLVAYREAGGAAVDGFRRVMRGVMGQPARALLEPGVPATGGAMLPPASGVKGLVR
jgi:DNA-binding MarR family transcriptional regulator